jgi:thiosulfate/3-mercaptopyruvate sulfurtransferase
MTKRFQDHFAGHVALINVILALSVSTACQMQPTKVTRSEQREFDLVVNKSTKPLVLTEMTVVLDARSAFDYGLNRINGSHHFRFENLAETSQSDEVMRDRRRLAQRLALIGLTPETPIVVVGNGPQGDGSEGRLAWTLLYLGFKDVQTASIEMFRNNMTQNMTPTPKNAAPAEIETHVAMVTKKDELKRLAQNPKERLENRVWLVDVRSEKEYAKNGATKESPDVGALNIEWTQFYTKLGRPDPNLKKKMRDLGIRDSDRVILVGADANRSSAAAYALISLGFGRVENFPQGWRSLQ